MPTSTHTETDSRWATTAAFVAEWEQWHAAHERRRADPHGFLAVTQLHWLSAAPSPLEGVPGLWSVKDDAVTMVLEAGESLLRDGRELSGSSDQDGSTAVVFDPIAEREGISLTAGPAVVELAKRGGEYIVRPRHPENALLNEYRGTPAYAPDPRFVVEGVYVAFEYATSGETTYAANRSLTVGAPDADGRVTLDFNRAVNLPCAYTDFATCPLPPAENRLTVAIEAGEQNPHERQAGQ